MSKVLAMIFVFIGFKKVMVTYAAVTCSHRVVCLLNVAVTKLREHWDETNSKVMQRKTQLDMMLGDSQRYEAKRNEVEVWLARMETRLERMRAVGHTADVLEAQLREQKVHRTLFPSFCK